MPTLDQHHSSKTTKLLLLGESGAGKTGSLISLVKEGYNLRIIDLDNGLDFLHNIILAECPERIKQVSYHTLGETFVPSPNQVMVQGGARAYNNALSLLNLWDKEAGIGHVFEWTENDVLVIDSLTFLSNNSMRFNKSLHGRLYTKPEWDDYSAVYSQLQDLFGLLSSPKVKCNVIATAHILGEEVKLFNDKGQITEIINKAAPLLAGRASSKVVGSYFNAILKAERRGSGKNEHRVIITKGDPLLNLKTAGPNIPPVLKIETGLATYFNLVRKGQSKPTEPKTKEK